MQDYEKLGAFYLGRPFDPAAGKPTGELLLYDSKDLVTHAVCFGMTGSGKTGLCLALLEEAAIDGVPALVIDPKGDISNLLLTFPDLAPKDFLPWINEDDARKKGLSPDDYAAQQAELWKNGLASWGQSPERIQKLKDSADFAIYTPGSTAGIPVSILSSFSAPPAEIVQDAELLREKVTATVTAMLGLAGIEADPLQSREHILLSTIMSSAWKQGQSLDLAALIQAVQAPPFTRVGVLDLESFYPARERFALSMTLNNLLASPGFETWLEGEPLDIPAFLHTPAGKPRVSIFSIAHLNDAERMFFVSLLLNQTVSWMRTQSGTTSLRAILYMDEIFGFFPPVANPPSKQPLLTLLKQARAFGLGVTLATQNPVDLDYKGLANAGTWFIGRLQTERDRARVLDGLQGAAGAGMDRQRLETVMAQLRDRVFLMNNVHEDAPVVLETRWVMSYLRGPLTRTQIKALTSSRGQAPVKPAVEPEPVRAPEESAAAPAAAGNLPVLPPDVPQTFAPVRGSAPEGATLLYRPSLIGLAQVRFTDAKSNLDLTREVARITPITSGPIPVDWQSGTDVEFSAGDLDQAPPAQRAAYEAPAGAAAKPKSYAGWNRDFGAWLYGGQTLTIFRSPSLDVTSQPGETERDFRVRLQQSARERRDEAKDNLRKKYAPKMAAITERIRRAEQAAEREKEQASQQKMQTAISVGATLLGAFLGRKTVSAGTLGRAATAVRSGSRAWKETQDMARAAETVDAMKQQLADLNSQFESDAQALETACDPATEAVESVTLKLKKTNINVRLVALCWVPYWQTPGAPPQTAY
jgi:hypothetical protein